METKGSLVAGWEVRVVKRLKDHKYFHEPREVYELRNVYIDESGMVSRIDDNLPIFESTLEELRLSLLQCFEKPIIEEVNEHPPLS